MDALNIPVCSQKVTSNIDKNHTSYETYCLNMFDCIDALEPQTLCASATDQIECTKIKNYKKIVDPYKQGIIDCNIHHSCYNTLDQKCECRNDPTQNNLRDHLEKSDDGYCTWKNNKCLYKPQKIPIVLISFIVVIVALLIVGLIVRAIIRGMTTTNQIQNPIIAFSTPITTR